MSTTVNNNITVNPFDNNSRTDISTTKMADNSIFDVHNNGVVDKGDFSDADLKNSEVSNFLNKYSNKSWTQTLADEIKLILSKLNSENLEYNDKKKSIKIDNDNLIITIKNKEYKIKISKDQSVTKNDIQNLFNSVKGLSQKELDDLSKEVNEIALKEDVFFGSIGFFSCFGDSIELSTRENAYGIKTLTLSHELGHGVSLVGEGKKYSYSNAIKKRFNDRYAEALLQKLNQQYGRFRSKDNDLEHGDGYALTHINEMFAEYYVYKNYGKTAHGSEKLFEVLEKSDDKDVKDLLKIFDKSIKQVSNKKVLRKTDPE